MKITSEIDKQSEKRKFLRNCAKAIVLVGVLPSLSACISLLPKQGKPPIVAQLRANNVQRVQDQSPFTVSVGLPIMPRALAGERVAIVQDNSSIAYLDGLLLSTTAPISIQNVILDTFDKSMAFRATVRGGSNSRADFELLFDVSRFDVSEPRSRHDGAANIVLTARLIDVKSRRPLAIRQFSATAPAKRGEVVEPVLALEAATQKISLDVMNWAVSAGKAFNPVH